MESYPLLYWHDSLYRLKFWNIIPSLHLVITTLGYGFLKSTRADLYAKWRAPIFIQRLLPTVIDVIFMANHSSAYMSIHAHILSLMLVSKQCGRVRTHEEQRVDTLFESPDKQTEGAEYIHKADLPPCWPLIVLKVVTPSASWFIRQGALLFQLPV